METLKQNKIVNSLFWIYLIGMVTFSIYSLFMQSIRLDEAQSLWIATKPIESIFKFTAEDVHVPLYAIILHLWLQVVGATISAARVISAGFLLLTIPVLYRLSKEASNSTVAKVTVGLFALSPFVMWYSTEARMYTMFALAASLSNLFYLRLLRSEGEEGKLGYFLSTLFGLYTHYFFNFLLATQGLFVLFRFLREGYRNYQRDRATKGKTNGTIWQYIWRIKALPLRIFPLMIIAFGLFAPWLWYFIHLGGGSNTSPLIPAPTSYNIFQTLILFIFGFQSQVLQGVLVSLWPVLIILLFLVFTQKRRAHSQFVEYFVLATFLPLMVIFVLSFIRPIFLARYMIFVIPTLFYLIALIFLNYSRRISTIICALILLMMGGLLIYQNVSASTEVKENYQGVASYISQQTTPEDIVAVTAPFTIYPIEYQYQGRARIDTIPEWDRFNQGSIPAFDENKLGTQIDEYKKQYSKLYVIFSYDQGYEQKIKMYLDTHLERLDQKTFSSKLELRVYKLRYDIKS